LTNLNVRALAINPQTPSTIYAGTNGGGVFRSINGGDDWTQINRGLTFPNVTALAINPQTPSTIYAGTPGGGVYRSINGGDDWTKINKGLTFPNVTALAINPQNPSTIYAGTPGGGVYRSINGGDDWTQINSGLTNRYVFALAINPQNPDTIYAGTGGGVYRSANSGDDWTQINSGLNDLYVNALSINPKTTSTIYAGTWGAYRSTNGGDDWTQINEGLTNLDVRALAINPKFPNPSIIYAGTKGGGVFAAEFMDAPLAITSIYPESGSTAGGELVDISGKGFDPGTTVTIGGTSAEVIATAPEHVVIKTPPGTEGAKDVKVRNSWDEEAVLAGGFTYKREFPTGDVSGDGTVSAYDASLILQFVVGLINKFPVELLSSPLLSGFEPRTYQVSVPDLSVKEKEKFEVPIIVSDGTNDSCPYAIAAGISLLYDATVLKPVKVSASPLISDYYLKYNIGIASQGSQGEIRMAFIGTKSADSVGLSPQSKFHPHPSSPVKGEGNMWESLLLIEFEALPFTSGKSSPLILNTVDLSGSVGITKRHGFVELLPSKTELLPNYPNPFNPETWIPYRLSEEADVTVYIYDTRGQLVRSFFLGTKPAGTYLDRGKAVYWDGKNDAGERVASGVYFYQLKAGRFSDTRKLAVMK
jgi:photosystem II stability/assembly factor-like uncharacterized protein